MVVKYIEGDEEVGDLKASLCVICPNSDYTKVQNSSDQKIAYKVSAWIFYGSYREAFCHYIVCVKSALATEIT